MSSASLLRRRPGLDGLDLRTAAVWAAGIVAVPALVLAAATTRPSLVLVGLIVAGAVAVVLVATVPAAVVPTAWTLIVFIGLVRKITAGSAGHVTNDPLIAAPYLLLVPLLFARFWWQPRYRAHLWIALVVAVDVAASFVVVLLQGDSSLGTVRAFVEEAVAPLCALVLVHPALRGSIRATLTTVRITTLLAGIYGIWQYVSPPRWDLTWLQSVVSQGVQTFGVPVPQQFRLFGPLSSPLSYALVLAVGIACWAFSSGRLLPRLAAIAVMALPLLLTAVRTSVFALVIALPIAAIIRYRQRAIVPLVVILAGVAAIPTVLAGIDPNLVNRFSVTGLSQDTSYNARLQLLSNSGDAVYSWGGGPGSSSSGSLVTDNGYLSQFIDYGLLGGVLLIVLVVAALVASVRFALRSTSPARGLPLVLVLVYGLSETSAPVIQGQQGLVFWVTLAILGADVAVRHGGTPDDDLLTRRPRRGRHAQQAGPAEAAPAAR
ncbi:hypothetical protein QDR37_03650 [Amnibacterium sp. CER49]|uniref:hypothetical protein n=1 Tax=Amnibacterium sp. CER49 TaxID=3039161 RepID=UPI00244B3D80|nr:hypothetical protein [Amnibacterium sp. CER49]MDH2443035.1 hypothetical protein [Amnibacterium sp. CER49]